MTEFDPQCYLAQHSNSNWEKSMKFVLALSILVSFSSHAEMHPGLHNLATKSYVTAFLTDKIWKELPRAWDSADRQKYEQAQGELARAKVIWDYYGFVKQPNRSDDSTLPMGLERINDEQIAMTCFICHGGAVNGVSVFGAPGNRLDSASFVEDVASVRKILKESENYDPQFLAPLAPLPPMQNIFKGTNNSFFDTVLLFSLRDPELNFLPVPADLGLGATLPFDVPALWNVHKKKKLYLRGSGGVTARTIMQFTLGSILMPEQIKAMEPDFEQVKDWILSTNRENTIGKFPGVINSELANKGREVFEMKCATCHGTYDGPDAEFPGLKVSINKIGTDRAFLDQTAQSFVDYSQRSWYNYSGQGQGLYSKVQSYVAPVLDGIWATPPYLHNGSVPTVRALLSAPESRPLVWKVTDYDNYDLVNLGFAFEESSVEAIQLFTKHEKRKFYDASQYGASNQGHDLKKMGVELEEGELDSVLEYLKTL